MKTQILRLEQHDDVISARDKMGWGQTGRILLVWPESGRILTRRLDLVLLQRHSQRLGAQLAFVTRDPDVRYHALELGIPVYRSLKKAQNVHWRLPRRFRRNVKPQLTRQSIPGSGLQRAELLREAGPHRKVGPLPLAVRLGIFSLGIIAVLALAVTLLPTATLQLSPQTSRQTLTLPLRANPDAAGINLAGSIPARSRQVIVEGLDNLFTSGKTTIPYKMATGKVRFTNLSAEAVTVLEGTVVRSQTGQRFLTVQEVIVPAGSGKTAMVSIKAAQAGEQGNLPAGAISAIEGLLGTRLIVENPQGTGGGADRVSQAPNQQDRQKLHALLLDSLRRTALQELQNSLEPDDLLIPSSLTLTRILEEKFSPVADDPADQISLQLRVEFEVLIVAGADVRELAGAVLDANLPDGYIPIRDSLEIEHQGVPQRGRAGGKWQIAAHREIQADLEILQAAELSRGLSIDAAMISLSNQLPLRAQPVIQVFPSWWPRMPVLPFRIRVILPAPDTERELPHANFSR